MIKEPENENLFHKDEQNETEASRPHSKKSHKDIIKDLGNIFLLTFLYVIEGIPLGVSFSVPLILSTRKVSYADQGLYSFASWPFSIRLLWAPIVDGYFIKKIGRRKTWIFMCEFLTGLTMLCSASFLHNILDDERAKNSKDIYALTAIFGFIVFLNSTKDIALDAWSIEILLEKNVSMQVLCNSVGMGIGQFIGNAGFLTFESKKFCNQYIRPFFNLPPQKHGIVTIEKFFYVFGSIAIVVSFVVLFLKNEYNTKKMQIESEKAMILKREKDIKERSLASTYKLIWKILKIKPILILILLTSTYRLVFSTESVIRLKLVEEGVAREKLSLLGILITPILTLVPLVLSKYIRGPKPLNYSRNAIGLKMIMILLLSIFVYFTPMFRDENKNFSYSFYITLFMLSLISGLFSFITIVSLGAFYARISDKLIGGTYLTFLTFWPSLGSNVSKTVTLFLINFLTFKKCKFNFDISMNLTANYTINSANLTSLITSLETNKCSNDKAIKNCMKYQGKCMVIFDAFYLVTAICLIFGILWLIFSRKPIKNLQSVEKTDWLVSKPI